MMRKGTMTVARNRMGLSVGEFLSTDRLIALH